MSRSPVALVAACALLSAAAALAQSGAKNVVDVASASPDHSTLVAALKAADYVESLRNPGPFTVFAPTNAAFALIPKADLDALMTPARKADLQNVLKHHVTVSTYHAKWLKDGQQLGMADGGKVTVHVTDGKVMIDDATIVASIPVSNGIIHVVDRVILRKP